MTTNKTNENLTNGHDFDTEIELDEKALESLNGGAYLAKPKHRKRLDSTSESDE